MKPFRAYGLIIDEPTAHLDIDPESVPNLLERYLFDGRETDDKIELVDRIDILREKHALCRAIAKSLIQKGACKLSEVSK